MGVMPSLYYACKLRPIYFFIHTGSSRISVASVTPSRISDFAPVLSLVSHLNNTPYFRRMCLAIMCSHDVVHKLELYRLSLTYCIVVRVRPSHDHGQFYALKVW